MKTQGSDSLARGDSIGTDQLEREVNPTGKILRLRAGRRYSSLTNKIEEEAVEDAVEEIDIDKDDVRLQEL